MGEGDVAASGQRWIERKPAAVLLGVLGALLTGWGAAIAVRINRDDGVAGLDAETIGRDLIPAIGIGMTGIALLMVTLVLVMRRLRSRSHALAEAAILLSIVFAIGIGLSWSLLSDFMPEDIEFGTAVTTPEEVTAYLAPIKEQIVASGDPYVEVPTGVYLQSFEFRSGSNVHLTGYIWQKFPKDAPAGAEPGFVLPEATDQGASGTPTYTRDEGGWVVYGWRISTVVRSQFDYSNFPLDNQTIKLRIWPRAPDSGVVLIPDFASYANPDPKALPGIEPSFVLGEWEARQSTFAFADMRFGHAFGYQKQVTQERTPDLYFHLGVARGVSTARISRLIRLFLIALVLWGAIVLTRNDEAWKGLSASSTLTFVAGLCFATVLDHLSLRESLPDPRFFYFEIYHVALYVALLLTVAMALVMASPAKRGPLVWRDGYGVRVFFWPVMIGGLFYATMFWSW